MMLCSPPASSSGDLSIPPNPPVNSSIRPMQAITKIIHNKTSHVKRLILTVSDLMAVGLLSVIPK